MKAFYKQRQSYMTLLETLIAISLLSMLLTFVFGFFRELSELTRMTEKAQKEMFQMRYVESRLGFIFERIVNENASSNRHFFFYTEEPIDKLSRSTSLILTFDNEVRLDPNFSGDVLGRLYVDFHHRLCLAIWPLHVSQPHEHLQHEVLLDHVVNVKYFFYAAPERLSSNNEIPPKKVDPEKEMPEKGKWQEDKWLIGYEQMPSLLKMVVQVAKNPEELKPGSDFYDLKEGTTDLVFHFVLPSSQNPVQHPAG